MAEQWERRKESARAKNYDTDVNMRQLPAFFYLASPYICEKRVYISRKPHFKWGSLVLMFISSYPNSNGQSEDDVP
jgi:hypothetical protein